MAEHSKYEALKALIVELFQTNGKLLEAGDRLSADLALTGARTQVIAALKLEARALTVAQIARRMGLQRQSVQRLTDILVEQGVLAYHPNPEHKRAKLVDFTAEGRSLYAQIEIRHQQWSERLAGDFTLAELEQATELLRKLRGKLDE
jgi:DNA-binding MarR family transcriptional regulator